MLSYQGLFLPDYMYDYILIIGIAMPIAIAYLADAGVSVHPLRDR